MSSPAVTGNLVEANMIGTNAAGTSAQGTQATGVMLTGGASNNVIGGAGFGAGNVISGNTQMGITLQGSGTTGNQVLGNSIGTNAAGTQAVPNGMHGVYVITGANGNVIGGTASGAGNVISGNADYGVVLVGVSNTLVKGNLIGVNAADTAALGNTTGVYIGGGSTNNTVGGTGLGEGNVISGNGTFGVWITDSTTANNQLQGNWIGVQEGTDAPLGNGSDGVIVNNGAHNNTIGGTAAGAGNIIAFNGEYGVLIGTDASMGLTTPAGGGNAIETNLIYSNSGVDDIHLGPTGTPLVNDANGHTGINNNYQNTPTLTSAQINGGSVTIAGLLTQAASPNTQYRIEFYAIASDGTKRYLGFEMVATNGSGVAVISATFTATVLSGEQVVATATDNLGNTSEFCASVTAGT
jgi:titin